MSEIMSPGDTPGRNALGMSRSTLFAAPTLIATGAHIRLLQALTAMPTGLRAVPSRIGSEINERPPPSTGKPNRRFVFCKNGAEASLLEARHSNGRHSAQFEMHCLRFCVFSYVVFSYAVRVRASHCAMAQVSPLQPMSQWHEP